MRATCVRNKAVDAIAEKSVAAHNAAKARGDIAGMTSERDEAGSRVRAIAAVASLHKSRVVGLSLPVQADTISS